MSPYLDQFAELVSREQFDLARASLLLAQDAYPALDITACIGQIDDMALSAAIFRVSGYFHRARKCSKPAP